MQIFPIDIIMGALLVITSITFLIGAYAWKGRREWPPLLLMISGIIGSVSPVSHLISITLIHVPRFFLIAIPLLIWIVGVIISISGWRRKG